LLGHSLNVNLEIADLDDLVLLVDCLHLFSELEFVVLDAWWQFSYKLLGRLRNYWNFTPATSFNLYLNNLVLVW
jgi:hypothetical protein